MGRYGDTVMLTLLMLLFVAGLLLGIPIAFCLGLASALTLVFVGDMPLMITGQMIYASADSFSLMAIPFFMLAGNLMGSGGISNRLVAFANIFFGRTTGGMGMVAIATSMFFAAISGSGPATVAAIGAIVIPAMINYNYDKGYAGGLMATAGAIGTIIPPSIPMIVYAVQAEVSVARIFMGGVLPGILFGLSLMILNYFVSRKHGYQYDRERGAGGLTTGAGGRAEEKCTWDVVFALFMPVIILGGIYTGIFTPTESAGVAVIYGVIVGMFVYKELSLNALIKVLIDSAVSTAMILLIIMFASLFSFILVSEGAPQALIAMINDFTSNPVVVLLLINVVLLIAGCFLDSSSAIIVLCPLLLPLISSIGVDPVHFGVVMIVNLAIGMVTPPVGINLYVACGIANISLESIIRPIWQFVITTLIVLMLVTYIPGLSLWLPNMLGN